MSPTRTMLFAVLALGTALLVCDPAHAGASPAAATPRRAPGHRGRQPSPSLLPLAAACRRWPAPPPHAYDGTRAPSTTYGGMRRRHGTPNAAAESAATAEIIRWGRKSARRFAGSVYTKKYNRKWPHCSNVACYSANTFAYYQHLCDKRSDCTGFSFNHGAAADAHVYTGGGCLKRCGSRESGGYGYNSHDYWVKNPPRQGDTRAQQPARRCCLSDGRSCLVLAPRV